MFGGLGLHGRGRHAQAFHVLVEHADKAFGQLFRRGLLLPGPVDDLVVDVGEVADIGDLEAPVTQVAHHHVKDQRRAGMADVAVVIGCDAADVHADMPLFQGHQGGFAAALGIEDLNGHGYSTFPWEPEGRLKWLDRIARQSEKGYNFQAIKSSWIRAATARMAPMA